MSNAKILALALLSAFVLTALVGLVLVVTRRRRAKRRAAAKQPLALAAKRYNDAVKAINVMQGRPVVAPVRSAEQMTVQAAPATMEVLAALLEQVQAMHQVTYRRGYKAGEDAAMQRAMGWIAERNGHAAAPLPPPDVPALSEQD